MDQDVPIDWLVRSRRRRTVSLEVTRDAHLVVRAPQYVPFAEIRAFVDGKQRWIRHHRERALERLRAAVPKRFAAGEDFLFLGRRHRLVFTEDVRGPLIDGEDLLFPAARRERAAGTLEAWYRNEAREHFGVRTERFAQLAGCSFHAVRVTGARKRWGSCTARGVLSFAWRLLMAPPEIIDYVVIHELAHRVHMNHSRRFWKVVESLCPEYRTRRAWLREHGHLLTF